MTPPVYVIGINLASPYCMYFLLQVQTILYNSSKNQNILCYENNENKKLPKLVFGQYFWGRIIWKNSFPIYKNFKNIKTSLLWLINDFKKMGEFLIK